MDIIPADPNPSPIRPPPHPRRYYNQHPEKIPAYVPNPPKPQPQSPASIPGVSPAKMPALRRSGVVVSERGRSGLVMEMENELIITGAFLGAGLLAFVIIPRLLVIWDRVLDHMERQRTD